VQAQPQQPLIAVKPNADVASAAVGHAIPAGVAASTGTMSAGVGQQENRDPASPRPTSSASHVAARPPMAPHQRGARVGQHDHSNDPPHLALQRQQTTTSTTMSGDSAGPSPRPHSTVSAVSDRLRPASSSSSGTPVGRYYRAGVRAGGAASPGASSIGSAYEPPRLVGEPLGAARAHGRRVGSYIPLGYRRGRVAAGGAFAAPGRVGAESAARVSGGRSAPSPAAAAHMQQQVDSHAAGREDEQSDQLASATGARRLEFWTPEASTASISVARDESTMLATMSSDGGQHDR
jgi:hypothetical protein